MGSWLHNWFLEAVLKRGNDSRRSNYLQLKPNLYAKYLIAPEPNFAPRFSRGTCMNERTKC